MSDRGIKKWAPYKTLQEQDFNLKGHKENTEKIEKPLISREFAEEINEILTNYHGEVLTIKYYRNGKIYDVKDSIKKIDVNDRKIILLSKKVIYLNEITSIISSEEDIL